MQNGSDADLLASEFVLPDCVTYLPDRAFAGKAVQMVKMVV